MMKSLNLPLVLLTLALAQAADANPLYSWTTKDGTPTYSPDPPPKGVSYEIVGADLQPLQDQPVASTQAATPAASQSATNTTDQIDIAPAPGTAVSAPSSQPKTPWKPVVYANDPNPRARTREPVIAAAESAPEAPPVTQVSEHCLQARQQLVLLESQFANAFSAKQMDDAIVRLHNFKKQNEDACRL